MTTTEYTGAPGGSRKLRSHALDLPTAEQLRRSLQAGTTVDVAALWQRLCVEAGVPVAQDRLELSDLTRVADTLAEAGGTVGLVGRATQIRVAAYRELAERGSDAPAPGWDWARVAMDRLLRERVPRPARQDELLSLDPFAPQVRADLDQAAARAAQRLGAAIGIVTIVLDGAQCFVGRHGMSGWLHEAGGTPVEWSFCATSVRTGEPYVVPDARADVLQRLNPLVLHDDVGSYAGAPLVTPEGEVLGSCCVLDPHAREYDAEQVQVLEDEATAIVAELVRRRDLRTRREGPTGGAD